MAHSLQAKKRIRQNEARNARNRWRKSRIKAAVRVFEDAVEEGNVSEAEAAYNKASSVLMKVATTPAIHKNTANRQRSHLAKQLNALKNAG